MIVFEDWQRDFTTYPTYDDFPLEGETMHTEFEYFCNESFEAFANSRETFANSIRTNGEFPVLKDTNNNAHTSVEFAAASVLKHFEDMRLLVEFQEYLDELYAARAWEFYLGKLIGYAALYANIGFLTELLNGQLPNARFLTVLHDHSLLPLLPHLVTECISEDDMMIPIFRVLFEKYPTLPNANFALTILEDHPHLHRLYPEAYPELLGLIRNL
jgi:hypothetical protein